MGGRLIDRSDRGCVTIFRIIATCYIHNFTCYIHNSAITRHKRGDADADGLAQRARKRTPMAARRPTSLPRRSSAWRLSSAARVMALPQASACLRAAPRVSPAVAGRLPQRSAPCGTGHFRLSCQRQEEATHQGFRALSAVGSPCFPASNWPFFCFLGPSIQIKHKALLEESRWYR